MSLRLTLNLFRSLFLVVTLVAIGARVAWTQFPEAIDGLDEWIVARSMHDAEAALGEAQRALRDGETEAAKMSFLKAADLTQKIQRGDRLEQVRAKSLTSLRNLAYADGELEEALRLANQLHQLNERDLPNELARGKLFGAIGDAEESIAILSGLYRLVPERVSFQAAYLEALIQGERAKEAVELILDSGLARGHALPLDGWGLRFRFGEEPWSAPQEFSLAGSGLARGGVELEQPATDTTEVPAAPLRLIRLDAPRAVSLVAERPALTATLSDGTDQPLGLAPGSEQIVRLNQLELDEDALRGELGSDPFVVLHAPELPEGVTVTGVTFQADLRARLPKAVKEFLESDLGATGLEEVEREFESGSGTAADRKRWQALLEMLHG